VYTGSDVKGQDGKLLKVVMYYNNKRVTWEPFSSVMFEILVVQGDFCVKDQESWSSEEFEGNLVKARKEVGVILTGVCRSKLSNGEAVLHGLKFKDNSSWSEGKKWQLGIRVFGCLNVRVIEAISEPFRVLDRHGKGIIEKFVYYFVFFG
jgi:Calmodulin binding protein-like